MQTGRWERKAEEGPSIWGPDHVLGKGSVNGRQRVAVPSQPGNHGGQPFSPSPPPPPCPFMPIPWEQLGGLWVRNMGPGLAYLGEAHAARCLSFPTHKVIFTVMPRVPQRSLRGGGVMRVADVHHCSKSQAWAWTLVLGLGSQASAARQQQVLRAMSACDARSSKSVFGSFVWLMPPMVWTSPLWPALWNASPVS